MMKWWGWGDPNIEFPMHEKPTLWPWIKKKVGVTADAPTKPIRRENIHLPTPKRNEIFLSALTKRLAPDQITFDEDERLLHSYGKSYPDLFDVRRGVIRQAPDMIALPRKHEDVVALVELAHAHNICLIPFGGGTNIVGCVEPKDTSNRMVVTVDMREMNQLLELDPYSNTATIQAGAIGPKLEKDLQERGFALGHHPDSFEYSTLGGWIATRSAGMQSDAYGKIEDMVVALRMVTPAGELRTRITPASSAGPDLNRIITGSEGTLGIITEATMRVHPSPAVKDYRGFLFKTFSSAVSAMHECYEKNYTPSMIRLQDSGETELALNMKTPAKGLKHLIQIPVKKYLKAKGFTSPCIMVVGFEGDQTQVDFTREKVFAIFKKYDCFPLGKSVGKTWSKDKYNVPYLRDYVMDYGVMVDVAETATVWKNIVPLHTKVIETMKAKFSQDKAPGYYLGCHLSHTYPTGCCLYFTYAAPQQPGRELDQYYEYKHLITETFVKNGATLSHHHAVGYEHRPWMTEEVSETGVKTLRSLKQTLDPKRILNPGKLIPDETTETTSTKSTPTGTSVRSAEAVSLSMKAPSATGHGVD